MAQNENYQVAAVRERIAALVRNLQTVSDKALSLSDQTLLDVQSFAIGANVQLCRIVLPDLGKPNHD
jgi:hypothetical protein